MDDDKNKTPSNPPATSKSQGFKGGKRKRSLSRNIKKGSNNTKFSRARARSDSSTTHARPIPPSTTSPASAPTPRCKNKPPTKAEVQEQLKAAQAEMASMRKTIESLKKKNSSLLEASQASRAAVRSSKEYAKQVEADAAARVKTLVAELETSHQREAAARNEERVSFI